MVVGVEVVKGMRGKKSKYFLAAAAAVVVGEEVKEDEGQPQCLKSSAPGLQSLPRAGSREHMHDTWK